MADQAAVSRPPLSRACRCTAEASTLSGASVVAEELNDEWHTGLSLRLQQAGRLADSAAGNPLSAWHAKRRARQELQQVADRLETGWRRLQAAARAAGVAEGSRQAAWLEGGANSWLRGLAAARGMLGQWESRLEAARSGIDMIARLAPGSDMHMYELVAMAAELQDMGGVGERGPEALAQLRACLDVRYGPAGEEDRRQTAHHAAQRLGVSLRL